MHYEHAVRQWWPSWRLGAVNLQVLLITAQKTLLSLLKKPRMFEYVVEKETLAPGVS